MGMMPGLSDSMNGLLLPPFQTTTNGHAPFSTPQLHVDSVDRQQRSLESPGFVDDEDDEDYTSGSEDGAGRKRKTKHHNDAKHKPPRRMWTTV